MAGFELRVRDGIHDGRCLRATSAKWATTATGANEKEGGCSLAYEIAVSSELIYRERSCNKDCYDDSRERLSRSDGDDTLLCSGNFHIRKTPN